jgi:hypothetical protein
MGVEKRLPRRRPLRERRQARCLQDPPNRRPSHAVAHVRKRALDPRVVPRRILRRHANDQSSDLEQHPASPQSPRVCPFPRNQLPMPAQQGIGRRDGGDLPQGPRAQPVRPRSQSTAIIVGETQPLGPELAPQESVLFDQVGDRLPLAAVQPASQHAEHQSAAPRDRSQAGTFIMGRPERRRLRNGTLRGQSKNLGQASLPPT